MSSVRVRSPARGAVLEAETKEQMVREWLRQRQAGGLLITRAANFAWLGAGARAYVNHAAEVGSCWLLVTPDQTYLVTNNIEAKRVTQEELPHRHWPVLSYPWWQEDQRAALIQRHVTAGPLLADGAVPGAVDVAGEVAAARLRLTGPEQGRLRRLGRATAQALEATCWELEPGETERAIAGRLTGRLARQGIDPVVTLVAADRRAYQYRHPLPTAKRLQRYALVAVSARQGGLVVSATRLVHFGPADPELLARLEAVLQVEAAMLSLTKPGVSLGALVDGARRAYAEVGFPREWQDHHQGGLAGYNSREVRAVPGHPLCLEPGHCVAWNPTIAGVKAEDTVLVTPGGPEFLTVTGRWPERAVSAGGRTWHRTWILER